MTHNTRQFPRRIRSEIVPTTLNEPVVPAGQFLLLAGGRQHGIVDGRVQFERVPTVALVREGQYDGARLLFEASDVILQVPPMGLEAPVLIAR